LSAVSCSEDEFPEHNNYFSVGTELPVNLVQGLIIDSGLVAPEVRHFHIEMLDPRYTLNNETGDVTGKGSLVNLGLFTAADGYIPSGTYSFVSGDNRSPFTCDEGFLTESYDFETGTGHLHKILAGTLIVFYEGGNKYDITFNCLLDTGFDLKGTFKGEFAYMDAHD
jgi:hypothetical protein